MATRRAEVQLPAKELVIDGEERNPGVTWPLAVDRWLELRLEQAREAGMATTRKELAAALMTNVDPNEDELVDLLRRYRRRRTGDLLGVDDDSNVIIFVKQGPGPRARRRS